uniref:RNase H type-1 domain-containing protein n=1 Tax=Cannabis sativa TaxID=3483 RepID=A0A803QAN4_CANSA
MMFYLLLHRSFEGKSSLIPLAPFANKHGNPQDMPFSVANMLRLFGDLSISVLIEFPAAQHKSVATAATSTVPGPSQQPPTPPTAAAVLSPWRPPTAAGYKLNTDAAAENSSNTIGVGAVLRDATGYVTAALSMPIIGNFKFHEMEAKALFHSLNWPLQQ